MKRVLIVDDAIDLGRMLKDALKTVYPSIPVSVVPSAEEALLIASRYTIDLLVTDLRLPGMTGLDLIRKIRLRQPDVRVILITGLLEDDQLTRKKDEVHPDVFLRKPIGASVFLDSVEKLIGEKSEPAVEEHSQAPEAPVESGEEAVLRELAKVLPGEAVRVPGKTEPLRKKTAARKTSGGLILPEASDPPQVEEGLSAVLSRLRGTLGALSVVLLDDSGRPVAQAGELPADAAEGQLIPSIMAAMSAGARVAYLLGQSFNQSVQAYRGTTLDLLAAPVGQYTLLVALQSGRTTLRPALAFEEALNAQSELVEALDVMGLHVSSTTEVGSTGSLLLAEAAAEVEGQEASVPAEMLETPLGQDPGLEKFEALFQRKETGQLHLQDPDAFWDEVTVGERSAVDQTGVISFDQAQKLGLVPDEKPEQGQ